MNHHPRDENDTFVRKAETDQPEFSLIIETFTFLEGGDRARFRKLLAMATDIVGGASRGELLVADVVGSAEVAGILGDFPAARRIDAVGLTYDAAKMRAFRASSGPCVLYVDSDCLPDPGWHLHMLAALRCEHIVACCGFTSYEGGFAGRLMDIMDWGFLYPRTTHPVGCYVSNNCAFRREALMAVPMPETDVRCACYLHAQLFERRGTPMWLVPEASVRHEQQPLIRERSRRGYDLIAACWVDPDVPEKAWLRIATTAPFRFYLENLRLDWQRLKLGWKDLGLTRTSVATIAVLLPLVRVIDLAGMFRAVLVGREPNGWGGWTSNG